MIQWFLILLFSITCQKASATPIPFAIDSSASKVPTFLGADKWDNGYPESRYQSVLAKVKDLYAPLIQGLGGELIFIADWTDGAVNMWAERLGDSYILEVPGGFPRYYLINEEAFLLTICHELGH